jgi:hypothetical protein
MDLADHIACGQIVTFGAGVISFENNTIPDLALGAVAKLDAGLPASGAINRFDRDVRRAEHLLPFFYRLCPEGIIVRQGGEAGIAFGAVQAATGNEFLHMFFVWLKSTYLQQTQKDH